MKIRCDVCEKEEASVFCFADEAALCRHCDRRVHHANKLAGKHQRFSLLHPSFKDSPSCDICQEKRAFLFCQEDRAILCRECDNSIHKANEHSLKHNRFLLSGFKLSPTEASSPCKTSTSSNESNNFNNAATESESEINKCSTIYQQMLRPTFSSYDHQKALESTSNKVEDYDNFMSQEFGNASTTTSSISEYLVETMPGWHVEDFLDPSCSSYDFSKSCDNMLSNMNNDLQGNVEHSSSHDMVPQFLPQSHDHFNQINYGSDLSVAANIKKSENVIINNPNKSSKKNNKMVLQGIPPLTNKSRKS